MVTPCTIPGVEAASNPRARSINTATRALQLVLLLVTCLAAAQGHAQVCRVTTVGTDTGDGSDWNAQAMDLHTALGDAGCNEIWVAGGVYKPDAGSRGISFTIDRQVEVYGGFDGTETMLGERDPAANPTVLSGDIDDNDNTNADGVTETAADIAGANSYHVLFIDGTTASGPITATTVLDGFTITAGQASEFPENMGGGLFCDGIGSGNECSPALSHVSFKGNLAVVGGAMLNDGGGGGNSSPALNNVTFSGNSASQGGAMFNDGLGAASTSSPALNNVTFSNNNASQGGAMFNTGVSGSSTPALNNVTFSGNTASNQGGAMFSTAGSGGVGRPVLNNVIVWGNNAPNGPGIFNFSEATTEINDSIVQGGCPAGATCNNVINQDPILGPPADNGGSTQTMLPGAAGAAVNAGNDATCLSEDQRGIPRPQGPTCDIGAVELAFPVLEVEVDGQGAVDTVAAPAPVSGGIIGCDAAGLGQSHCAATYTEGDNVVLILAPAAGWQLESAAGCGGVLLGNAFTTDPLRSDCMVEVAFAINQHTVTPAVTAGMGTITPDGAQIVDHGGTIDFTITPETGWSFDSVGGTCPGTLAGGTYTAGPVTADCTVEAAFVQNPVDGQCGAADGGVFSEPPGEDLCAAGESTKVLGDGPWTWTCQGIAGGEDAQCGADSQSPLNEIFGDRFEE